MMDPPPGESPKAKNDFYAVLGIGKLASPDEIKKRYPSRTFHSQFMS